MATNLNLDDELARILAKTGADTGWSTEVATLLDIAFTSTKTPFNDNAKSASAGSVPPIGAIVDFAGGTIPAGYAECDGRSLSRVTYGNLFRFADAIWIDVGIDIQDSRPSAQTDYRKRFQHGCNRDDRRGGSVCDEQISNSGAWSLAGRDGRLIEQFLPLALIGIRGAVVQ